MQANFHKYIARLITEIQSEFSVPYFVESGTNVGETAEWASERFREVTTIELDDDLYETATDERGDIENISFVKGNSAEELESVLAGLDGQAVVHLDAHCGGKWLDSAGDTSANEEFTECPLMDELDAFVGLEESHYLFIDDARVFTSPRREPFDPDDWPTLQEVVHKLEDVDPDYDIIIYLDEIIAVPEEGSSFVRDRIRTYKTEKREASSRFRRYIMNKVWQHASLSGPVRDI